MDIYKMESCKYAFLCIFMLMCDVSCNFATKPNVLLIIVDDLRHLSDTDVDLINIRKMAASGVNFKNAFAQQALCAPSRNSLLTGRRPDALRLYDFYSYWRETVGNFTTLPQLFKEYGYETYSVGKVFHEGASSNYNDDYPYSWSQKAYHPPTAMFKDAAVCRDSNTLKLQKNLICPVHVGEQPGKSLPDLQSLNYAAEILRQNRSKPLFLAVGFYKPHIPLKYPEHYLEKIPITKVRPPKFPWRPSKMPLVAWHPWTDLRKRDDIRRLNISFPMGIMPDEWTLKIRQSYYAAALYIDDLIGELLRHVDLKKTIVVLTSDHGWSLGENGLWAKYSNFDVALKVPLIIKAPNSKPQSIGTPVELIDIFPTLASLAGLNPIPKCKHNDKSILCVDGKNLIPLMKKVKYKNLHNTFAISQYPRPSQIPGPRSDEPRLKDINIMGYSIRTQRFRYTEWVEFNHRTFTRNWNKTYGFELYDHVIDREEHKNLFKNKRYSRIVLRFSEFLRSKIDLGLASPKITNMNIRE